MKIENYAPSTLLASYIKSYMIIESIEGMESNILPETSMVMAFRIRGNVAYTSNGIIDKLPASVITGIRKSIRHLEYSKNTATLLVKFHEGGAAAFFKEPLHELQGASLSLDDLISKSKVSDIEEQLAEAKNHAQCIVLIEQFLISAVKKQQQDILISKVIRQIQLANGNISINVLLQDIPLSRDAFEKRFRKTIGTSPKQYATIIRLKNLIDNYPKSQNLTEAAYSSGYFDQSHLIKDFRAFTGQAPHEFFKSAVWW